MLAQIERELVLRGGLYDFVQVTWSQVESTPFVPGWHLEAICEHLEAVSRVEIRKLLINVPPGAAKSLLSGVFWQAWEWLDRPGTRFINASFDMSLPGTRDGGKIIRLLQSSWWAERFQPLLDHKSPSAFNFDIKGGGFRFATSPRSRGTGRHGNIVVVDDPIKPADTLGGSAITHKRLDEVSSWWKATMPTRRADPATHREVIVMQRLHKDDLSGEMARAGGWTVLRLPMRFEKTYSCPGDRRTEDGELLWPARFPLDTVIELEKSLDTHAAGQLQQRPHALGGTIFRRSRWRFWGTGNEPCLCNECFDRHVNDPGYVSPHDTGRPCRALPESGFDLISADLAFKGTQHSDFVALQSWRTYGGDFFMLDLVNERLDFADTKIALLRFSIAWPTAGTILIEDAANGPAIESELRHSLGGIELVRPEGGKEARAQAVAPLFSAGSVFLPAAHPGIWHMMSQAEAFPMDLNDDEVDSLTQALVYFRAHGYSALFEQAMTNARKDMAG
jgi:predicted phage terminase large subunit-like protein